MGTNDYDGDIVLDAATTSTYGFGLASGADFSFKYGSKANGGFAAGNTITGVTSGATGTVVSVKDNGSADTGVVYYTRVSGAFQNAENVTVGGTVRGATTTAATAYANTPTHATIGYIDSDPSGVVTALKGSLLIRGDTGALYQNTDGGTTWTTR